MPTSLDDGRRSPRKLLRAVVARLLGRPLRWPGSSRTTRWRVRVLLWWTGDEPRLIPVSGRGFTIEERKAFAFEASDRRDAVALKNVPYPLL